MKKEKKTGLKDSLRQECERLKITYLEKDGIKDLRLRLKNATPLVTVDESQLPYAIMDAEDDKQVMASMSGARLEDFVYSFPSQGKTVIGISKAGVDELCRQSAKKEGIIYEDEGITDLKDEGDYFHVTVKVGVYRVIVLKKEGRFLKIPLGTHPGSKRQWKKMKLRNGSIVPDPFWYEKAMSKANRNARHDLLPYQFIKGAIKKYLKRKGVDTGHVKHIQMDGLVGTSELQIIHGVGNQLNIGHDRITSIAKGRRLIQKSLNELRKADVEILVEALKGQETVKSPSIPFTVLGIFNSLDYKKAMQTATWEAALKIRRGDATKAEEDLLIRLRAEAKKKGVQL